MNFTTTIKVLKNPIFLNEYFCHFNIASELILISYIDVEYPTLRAVQQVFTSSVSQI